MLLTYCTGRDHVVSVVVVRDVDMENGDTEVGDENRKELRMFFSMRERKFESVTEQIIAKETSSFSIDLDLSLVFQHLYENKD